MCRFSSFAFAQLMCRVCTSYEAKNVKMLSICLHISHPSKKADIRGWRPWLSLSITKMPVYGGTINRHWYKHGRNSIFYSFRVQMLKDIVCHCFSSSCCLTKKRQKMTLFDIFIFVRCGTTSKNSTNKQMTLC